MSNGQGNNQSDADLNIPRLGAAAAPAPIIQPGEDAGALAAAAASEASLRPPEARYFEGNPQSSQPPAAESLADLQAKLRNSQAMHRPVIARHDQEQEAEVPRMSVEIPGLHQSLDSMRRPDQMVEPVTDLINFESHAAHLAFLEELLIINVAETADPNMENPVVLGINGRNVAIWRGQDTIVKRKYVEMLLRAKPETIRTRQERNGEGDVKNHIDKMRALKYPFSIVREDNPRGKAWARKIRSEA